MSASAPAPRRTHQLPRTADLVVIGGGVVGAAVAFFARRAGLDAVVLEKRPALGTLSTAAATGAFRLQFDNPEELALVGEGVELYLDFADRVGLPSWDLGIHQQGYLWLATTAATARRQREVVEQQRSWGLGDVELLERSELRARFPYLAEEVLQARFRAGDGWLEPMRLTLGFAAASQAPFLMETMAQKVQVAGGRVTGVETSRGTIATDRVAIAAGPYCGALARAAGVELPLALVRRLRLILPEVPEVPPRAPMTIDEENGVHWRPALRGANVLWPEPGIAPEGPLEDVPGDDGFAFRVLDPDRPTALARISPFWRAVWERGTTPWVFRGGQYDYTPDHRPYLGPTPVTGLFVACGFSGHGVMSSAGAARLTVDTMLGKVAPAENPFRLDRPMQPRDLDVL